MTRHNIVGILRKGVTTIQTDRSAILQMDQAEPENQILHRYQQECGHDADLDCAVCLSTAGIHQVPVEAEQKHAANSSFIAAQFVRETGPDGLASRRTSPR